MRKDLTIKIKSGLILLFVFSVFWTFSQTSSQQDDLRTIVTLLDYVAKDYKVAVENGEIIDSAEYDEQINFTEKMASLHQELVPVFNREDFNSHAKNIDSLLLFIKRKETSQRISEFALWTKNELLNLGILKISPAKWPSVNRGRTLFLTEQNCATCHGNTGRGDGDLGKGLEPEPTNFWDEENMDVLSPLQAYNVIKLGVTGTAMASYDQQLSENEIWDLAFYILSLRYAHTATNAELPGELKLEDVAKWTDPELNAYLKSINSTVSVEEVRAFEPQHPAPITVAKEELDKSYQIYQQGDRKLAEHHALNSYLEGIELIESVISASNPETVRKIEREMIQYRNAIKEGNDEMVSEYYLGLKKQMEEIEVELEKMDYSFSFIFGAGLSILIREALEALLIILVMISVLKPMQIKNAVTAVHIGWITAVALGFLSWFFVDYLVDLSGASREMMEGIGAIIAVVVLLYVGTWLHSHSEAKKWTHFIKTGVEKIKNSGGNWFGLTLFSFIVVFREAFEVVLFLSSLKLSNPEVAGKALGWALVVTAALMAVIAFFYLKTAKKLPVTTVFKISAYVIALLTIVLAGKGVAALQETGTIGVTHISGFPQIEILGIYPNVQVLSAQIFVLILLIFLTKRAQRKSKIMP